MSNQTAAVRRQPIAYWTITAVVVAECLIGGAMDLLRLPPFFPVLIELGYPAYLAGIIGLAKIAAGVVVVAPGLPRLKEWAYAGILINMLGAAASHLADHRALSNLIAPLLFGGLALASWALRPADRRL
jgi:DoxX-like protein